MDVFSKCSDELPAYEMLFMHYQLLSLTNENTFIHKVTFVYPWRPPLHVTAGHCPRSAAQSMKQWVTPMTSTDVDCGWLVLSGDVVKAWSHGRCQNCCRIRSCKRVR